MLQCNIISHWLSPYPELSRRGRSLQYLLRYIITDLVLCWSREIDIFKSVSFWNLSDGCTEVLSTHMPNFKAITNHFKYANPLASPVDKTVIQPNRNWMNNLKVNYLSLYRSPKGAWGSQQHSRLMKQVLIGNKTSGENLENHNKALDWTVVAKGGHMEISGMQVTKALFINFSVRDISPFQRYWSDPLNHFHIKKVLPQLSCGDYEWDM